MSDKQDISKVQDSTINQAGRELTVNYGLSAADVIAIVREVVASELAIYSQNAEKKAEERLNQFSKDLVGQLAEKVADKLDKFNEPSLQFAVREAALSFVKSGKDADEKALIDLMIERVKVDEHSTRQKLIDQAIKVVPNLSTECLALLSMIVFRSLILTGKRTVLEHWIDSVNPILHDIQNATSLDIEYLIQADCVTAMSGIMTQDSWLESCPKQNNLFFRHPVPSQSASAFLDKYGITIMKGGFTLANPSLFGGVEKTVIFFAEMMDFGQDGTIRFNVTNSEIAEQLIAGFKVPSVKEDIQALINASALFSPVDVKNYFVNRNPMWAKAIELIDGQRLRSFNLLPIGAYIGARQLSMLSGRDVALETFYK